jgi:hypothetical protein
MMRRSLPIDLGSYAEGERWTQHARTCSYPFTHGHLSGLPLLLYNSHLLWSCRALESFFPSSWHYLRSLVALAIIAMAIEFSITHKIVDRTNNFIRSQTTDFGSHQPNFGADSVIRARDFHSTSYSGNLRGIAVCCFVSLQHDLSAGVNSSSPTFSIPIHLDVVSCLWHHSRSLILASSCRKQRFCWDSGGCPVDTGV